MNVNIAATTVENYRRLRDAGIGTYILFQETYDKAAYEALHPTGPKSDYAYHTEAMDRAMQGGIDDVGIGVLFGLTDCRYDFTGLLMHAEHLEAVYGVGPHTISVPRICPADDIDTAAFPNAVSGRAVPPHRGRTAHRRALHRHDRLHARVAALARAGARTGHLADQRRLAHRRGRLRRGRGGGVARPAQFDVSDTRTLDQIVGWLVGLGYIPSFCTACYREGRTGDRFMQLAKQGARSPTAARPTP